MKNDEMVVYVWQVYKTPEMLRQELNLYRNDFDKDWPKDFTEETIAEMKSHLNFIIKNLEDEIEEGGHWSDMEGKTNYRYIKQQRQLHIDGIYGELFGEKYTYKNTRIVKGVVSKSSATWVGYKQIDW